MSWPNITREDQARWPDETWVLMDLPWSVRTLDDFTCECDLKNDVANVKPYHMQPVPLEDGSIFGINAASYALWAGNDADTSGALRMEGLLSMLYRESCPLVWVMDFDFKQKEVPVAGSNLVAAPWSEGNVIDTERGWIRIWWNASEPSPTSMTRFGPRRRFQEKPSRVPVAVEQNRKRLDGRRR